MDKNCLTEAILMSTNNIFYGEITIIMPTWTSNTLHICSIDCDYLGKAHLGLAYMLLEQLFV